MYLKVLGQVRSKKNSKVWTGKYLVSSKAYKKWNKVAVLQMKAKRHQYPEMDFPIDYPVSVKIHCFYKTLRWLDIDNMVASCLDPLEDAGIIDNDKLVRSLDGTRSYLDRDNPRIEIWIEPFAEHQLKLF